MTEITWLPLFLCCLFHFFFLCHLQMFLWFVAAVPNVDIHSVHLSCSGRNSDGVGVQIVLSFFFSFFFSLSFSSWGGGVRFWHVGFSYLLVCSLSLLYILYCY